MPKVGPSTALKLIKNYKKIENIDKYSEEQLNKLNYQKCRELFNFINQIEYELFETKINNLDLFTWCDINNISYNEQEIININNIDNQDENFNDIIFLN